MMAGTSTKHALCLLILSAFASAAGGQTTGQSRAERPVERSSQTAPKSTSSHLVTPDEGLAIIGAALDARHLPQANGDCSHVVHAIYEQAGFRYRYAGSSELYDGVEEFRQVTHPQPGDLAVWRGHAAIVINPAQHSFFGATSRGLRVESYDLGYWKQRGAPRFFRFIKPASSSGAVTRTALAESADSDNQPTADAPPPTVAAPIKFPSVLAIHALQPKPQQVYDMLSQTFDETAKSLRGEDVLKLSQTLVVFDRIEVKSVHLKGDHGWAEVKMDGLTSVIAGRGTQKKRSEQQRWTIMRRDAGTWELAIPPQTAYLPHDVAVRVLAHQLASLADRTSEDGPSQDQAQLARTLNLLLEK
jgi:hypothetical protein